MKDNLVEIFAEGPDVNPASVSAQEEFYRDWLASQPRSSKMTQGRMRCERLPRITLRPTPSCTETNLSAPALAQGGGASQARARQVDRLGPTRRPHSIRWCRMQ
jgi:hypothetical protein